MYGGGRGQEEGPGGRQRSCMAVKADSLEDLYATVAPQHMDPGWNKPTASLWPEPRKTYLPDALELSQRPRRAGTGRALDRYRARRAPQHDPGEPDRGQHLQHESHADLGVSDAAAGRARALAPPHAQRLAPDRRERRGRLHDRQRREDHHAAGRRRAHAVMDVARPRQHGEDPGLLDRLPRRAAGALDRVDVLREPPGRFREQRRALECVAAALHLDLDRGRAERAPKPTRRTVSAAKSPSTRRR